MLMAGIIVGFVVMLIGITLSILVAKSLKLVGASVFILIMMVIAGWAVMFSPVEFSIQRTETAIKK